MIDCETIRFDSTCKISEIQIYYSFHESPFGKCLIGFIQNNDKEKVVCYLSFADNNEIEVFKCLKTIFPDAQFIKEAKDTKALIDKIFYNSNLKNVIQIKVLLKGSNFQIKVWESLIKIPIGTLVTYQQVAQAINKPKAARAVANAIKTNQIGYLIPCHRVLCKSGCNKFSWGVERKINMQEHEKQLSMQEEILKYDTYKK